MSEEFPNPAHDSLVSDLCRLQLPASQIDRDRLFFLAGQASTSGAGARSRRGWMWPVVTLASLAVAVGAAADSIAIRRAIPAAPIMQAGGAQVPAAPYTSAVRTRVLANDPAAHAARVNKNMRIGSAYLDLRERMATTGSASRSTEPAVDSAIGVPASSDYRALRSKSADYFF